MSVAPSGGNFVITLQLCIGAGVTGLVRGGDGATQDILFGIYGPSGGPVNIVSFSPDGNTPFLTSTFGGCEMPGYDIGPLSAPFDCQASIYYAWDGLNFPACAPGFTCISPNATCGNARQECYAFTMVLDAMPDSIRVFGVEGNGNPTGGCYPNADMKVEFTTLPVVWGEQKVRQVTEGNRVEWTTLVETNCDHFEVLRSQDGFVFDRIGVVSSQGNGNSTKHYSVLDEAPVIGMNYYKIRQVDVTGDAQESNVMRSEYITIQGFYWVERPGLNMEGEWNASFFSEAEDELTLDVFNTQGVRLRHAALQAQVGLNELKLLTADWARGVYVVVLKGKRGVLQHRLAKI